MEAQQNETASHNDWPYEGWATDDYRSPNASCLLVLIDVRLDIPVKNEGQRGVQHNIGWNCALVRIGRVG